MAWAQEFNISQGSTARPVSKTSPARSYCLHRLPLSLQPFLLASILYPDEAAPSKVTEVFFAKVMAFLVFSSPASPWSTLQHWHPVDIAQHSPPHPAPLLSCWSTAPPLRYGLSSHFTLYLRQGLTDSFRWALNSLCSPGSPCIWDSSVPASRRIWMTGLHHHAQLH